LAFSDITLAPPQVLPPRARARSIRTRLSTVQRLIITLVPSIMFLPSTMAVFIGTLKFLPGRIPAFLLFVPALAKLISGVSKHQRRFVASDLFMAVTSAWMIAAPWISRNFDTDVLVGAGAEVLELAGVYFIARTFIFGRTALELFIRVMKYVVSVVIFFAVFDWIFGWYFINNLTAAAFGAFPTQVTMQLVRSGLLRAQSTIDHPILFGSLCCFCTTIFLYSETGILNRVRWAGLCSFGVILSLSSGPLLGLCIGLGVFAYDWACRSFAGRWLVLWCAILGMVGTVFLLANSPIGWIISHLTFDPENGYYRMLTWFGAFDQIALSPFVGSFRQATGNFFLDVSVDCVWLVIALQYGLPTLVFHFLANFGFALGFEKKIKKRGADPYMDRMRTGFTVTLCLFTVVGLTVHFWSSMWMFWALCIGIRASLHEDLLLQSVRARQDRMRSASAMMMGAR
jgi:hypothetical protein